MGKNGMVQWAPGTRLQRINRNDGTYEVEMAALKKRVDKVIKTKPFSVRPLFKEGDIAYCTLGNLVTCGEVDPNGQWVMVGTAKMSVYMLRKLPGWFLEQWDKLLIEMVVA